MPDSTNEGSSSTVNTAVASWISSPHRKHFTVHQLLPGSAGRTTPFPGWMATPIVAALERLGITSLYHHQARSLDAAQRGADVVLATPTASGKTLCYNIPVLQRLLEDPNARALYIFPTKALARDQLEAARRLVQAVGQRWGVAVYDGDTPADERRAARRARILMTNPEMLHAGLLPHHPSWADFFAGLRHVVIDELHTYRGVFGSHVANVLRRLRRIAAFHGADPRLISASATIANPDELAETLWGGPVEVVAESSAPNGERHWMIYNPPVVDAALGIRASYLKTTCALTLDLIDHGVSTLVFCRSRRAVEVLVHYLRSQLAARQARLAGCPSAPAQRHAASDNGPGSSVPPQNHEVRGYRGGYLPDRRREIEQALRVGDTRVVVATSALELGIDIGSLDAVVLAGWPGSRAAAWQRAGRAGRRMAPSLALMVASSEPIDQFVATGPEYFFGQAPEHARLDPDNVAVLVPHLKCAAFELPLRAGEAFGSLQAAATAEALAVLAEAGELHRGREDYHYVGAQFPANDVTLRGPLDENFLVVQQGDGEVLAEVDYRDAPQTLHEHAIYQIEGAQYEVLRLEHDQRKAFVQPVRVDYYTDAMTYRRLRVLERSAVDGCFEHGEVHVHERVVGFKKIKLHTHENIGYGDVNQPDREMHTTGVWLTVAPGLAKTLDVTLSELASACVDLAHVLRTAAALLLMSDTRDLGQAVGDAQAEWSTTTTVSGRGRSPVVEDLEPLPQVHAAPRIFLYDQFPGGTGLCERLFEEHAEWLRGASRMLAACGCTDGCPGCIGPGRGSAGKRLATAIARELVIAASMPTALVDLAPESVATVIA